jgi:hypothetical protein
MMRIHKESLNLSALWINLLRMSSILRNIW